jgi:hypothetical protein
MSVSPETVDKLRIALARQRQRAAEVRIENARKARQSGKVTPAVLGDLTKRSV